MRTPESETGFDCGGFSLVAGLFEKGEHVTLVGLHAGLVEGVDIEQVARDATRFLEDLY